MTDVVSFAIGDVVKFVKAGQFNKRKLGTQGIITDSSAFSGSVRYAVDGNAWIDFDHLELVHRATVETLASVYKMLRDEEDEDIDDCEDE